jgi:hypothetical protein
MMDIRTQDCRIAGGEILQLSTFNLQFFLTAEAPSEQKFFALSAPLRLIKK